MTSALSLKRARLTSSSGDVAAAVAALNERGLVPGARKLLRWTFHRQDEKRASQHSCSSSLARDFQHFETETQLETLSISRRRRSLLGEQDLESRDSTTHSLLTLTRHPTLYQRVQLQLFIYLVISARLKAREYKPSACPTPVDWTLALPKYFHSQL